MNILLLSVLILALFYPVKVFSQTGTDVNNLLTHLFTTRGYNKKIRPLTDQNTAVQIGLDFFLNGETGSF
jgi:hypothetical protein